MRLRRTTILLALLVASAATRGDTYVAAVATSAEYRAELDRLLTAAKSIDGSAAIPETFHNLPGKWHVRTDHGEFDISSEGLKRDVRRYDEERTKTHAEAIRIRLGSLRDEISGFEKAPEDVSAQRARLDAILARPEFHDVHGQTWVDRLKRWIFDLFLRILRLFFRSTTIPTIGRFLVYTLMGVALAALLYVAYRSFWADQRPEEVVPSDLPVSAKEWSIWLSEARVAAAKGEWRDAIHLAYWAGISFLERKGLWKPDRARTPREYLRLLAGSSEHRETLITLTRIFELAWYAKRDADEQTFTQTLAQLEKLGCQ